MDMNEIRRQEAERDRLLRVNEGPTYRPIPIHGIPAKGSITADLKAAQDEVERLKLQIEAWRPVLQAAIVLIGKNISRPEVFRDTGDTRKYELAVALLRIGDKQREEMGSFQRVTPVKNHNWCANCGAEFALEPGKEPYSFPSCTFCS